MAPTDRETKGEFCARIMTLISYRSDRAWCNGWKYTGVWGARQMGRQGDSRHAGWRAGEVCSCKNQCSWETSRGVRDEA